MLISTAYLHDVIEDTKKYHPERLTQLRKEIKQINKRVLEYVEALSHNKLKSYENYIKDIAKNNKLILVKFIDLRDNVTDFPAKKQKEKYKKALTTIFKTLTH